MSDAKYQGDKVLDIMSSNATNRNRSIEKLIHKHIFKNIPKGARVLEFGAGKGEFIFRFTDVSEVELSAIEVDSDYSAKLSEKVKVYNSLNEVEGELDGIYLIDVLEHIEDDAQILRQFYTKLKKNGRLFIYVPARMELYSAFDKRIGHFRRYSLKQINELVTEAGFKIHTSRYHELLGYFASGLNKLFNRSGDLNPNAVKMYDVLLVPVTNMVERLTKVPIGKSIYISARKN